MQKKVSEVDRDSYELQVQLKDIVSKNENAVADHRDFDVVRNTEDDQKL